jgi:hypothetical protein
MIAEITSILNSTVAVLSSHRREARGARREAATEAAGATAGFLISIDII